MREAVAASCGVPALLAPLQIEDLYPGVAVSLVDGGVQDNQGVGGLLDQGCTSIVVSAASGQLRELLIVHLTKGLQRANVDWIGCDDPKAEPAAGSGDTDYGEDRAIQVLLAGALAAAHHRTFLGAAAMLELLALVKLGVLDRLYRRLSA